MTEMTEQDALDLITSVCAEFDGKLKQHQMIQQALQTVFKVIKDLRASIPAVEKKELKIVNLKEEVAKESK